MGVEAQEIKDRVSLRGLLERDNVAVRKSGASLVACCPIHNESTPSFHLHEEASGDWFKCFGCDAKGDIFQYWQLTRNVDFRKALEDLAAVAGLGGALSDSARPLPKREVRVEETPVKIAELDAEAMLKWERAAAELYTDSAEVARWAAWRGLRPAVIEWAARRGLCGRVMMYGEWREAFLIRDVAPWTGFEDMGGTCMRNIGFHVRLAPRKAGEKASWRYSNRWVAGERLECEASRGLGAWPFVVLPEGFEREWKYIFCCEGQWDALALIDVMGWDAKWPAQVAVFGMRGATSWKKFLEYDLRKDAVAFLLADNDAAGRGWFVGDGNFSEELKKRVKAIHGYWPAGGKDLNDEVRGLDEAGREIFRANLRKRIAKQKGKVKMKPTFLKWLRGEKKKNRTDGVVEFAAVATRRGAAVPKGRVRKRVWVKFVQGAWPEHEAAFLKAWAEWEALDASSVRVKFEYKGVPPFADAEWADNPDMCQWCAGTGHPHGNPRFGICECPDLEPSKELICVSSKSTTNRKREPFVVIDGISVWSIDGMMFWYATAPGAANRTAGKSPTEKQSQKQFDVRKLPNYSSDVADGLKEENNKRNYHAEVISCAIRSGYRLEAFK